jgi:hypothetical protein
VLSPVLSSGYEKCRLAGCSESNPGSERKPRLDGAFAASAACRVLGTLERARLVGISHPDPDTNRNPILVDLDCGGFGVVAAGIL